ncbi:MAG TPA: sigma-70 family RNA polymerase sigma factor [Beijerinckiaceae bacterium]|jgi:RNA polymerase sigma-70 factor (ECF subfamily)
MSLPPTSSDTTDCGELLVACARGDAAALRAIYDHEGGRLFAVALRIVRDRDLAGDVLHDAFVSIWQKASTFDPGRSTGRGWLIAVVRHQAFKALRTSRREVELDEAALQTLVDDGPDALALLSGSEEAAALRRCLEALDRDKRRVILLAYVDGLSHAQISGHLGVPLGTVKAWVRRGLGLLKGCLA